MVCFCGMGVLLIVTAHESFMSTVIRLRWSWQRVVSGIIHGHKLIG